MRAGRLLPVLVASSAPRRGAGSGRPRAPAAAGSGDSRADDDAADAPPTIVDADLRTSAGAPSPAGRLVVTLGEPRTGLEPPVSDTEACDFDPAALQYLPVAFASTAPGLAAHLEVATGPGTPADVGDVGIFVESNSRAQVYCTDSPPLPTRDSFYHQAGAREITAWVVLQRAVTPATPAGRPEVFRPSSCGSRTSGSSPTRRRSAEARARPLGVGAPVPDEPGGLRPAGLTRGYAQPTPAMSSSTCRPRAVAMS